MDTTAPRATKIVATMGPASSSAEVLERMLRAGVDVVRLNFSHGSAQDHIDRAALVREIAKKVGKEVAIMADLQGPKIRVGKIEGGKTMLEAGGKLVLDAAHTGLGTNERVGLDYKELPRDVRPGDTLLLNDGLLRLVVDSVRGEEVHTRIVVGGELSNNKGINKAGGGLTAPALTAKDMEDIKTAMAFQCEYLAVSFPKSATDMEMARQLANVAGEQWRHKPQLIAKIERSEAIPALEAILRASDGIMVARGDLGVEVPLERIALTQKDLIARANQAGKPVITATQMLESMVSSPLPTRAEATDVANAILDGTDCIMLSAESAVGRYPVEAVAMLARIASATEAERPLARIASRAHDVVEEGTAAEAIASVVERALESVPCAVVFVLTRGGATARMISRYKPPVWVAALSTDPVACQALTFSCGVLPIHVDDEPDDWRAFAVRWLDQHRVPGNIVMLVAGPSERNPEANHRLEFIRVERG
jgi:pyruvate kinase